MYVLIIYRFCNCICILICSFRLENRKICMQRPVRERLLRLNGFACSHAGRGLSSLALSKQSNSGFGWYEPAAVANQLVHGKTASTISSSHRQTDNNTFSSIHKKNGANTTSIKWRQTHDLFK